MIIDGRKIAHNSTLETDLCVVGAGAAGISLAREFAKGPHRVLLLESGGFEMDTDTQQLYDGRIVGLPYFPLTGCRLRFFGGTTGHWGGWCHPPTEEDFAGFSWIPNSGWPFPKTAMDSYYQRGHKICELGPYNYDPSYWQNIATTPILPTTGSRLATVMCQFSPPTRFGTKYRNDVSSANNITLALHSNALEISSANGMVTGVRCATLQKNQFSVKAKFYVIAAGGLESARLLLLSSRDNPRGLGNENDLVGRFFADSFASRAGRLQLADNHPPLGFYRQHLVKATPVKGYLAPNHATAANLRLNSIRYSLSPVYVERYERAAESEGAYSLYYLLESFKAGKTPDDFAHHVANVVSDIDDVVIAAYRKLRFAEMPVDHYEIHVGQDCVPNHLSRVTLTDERDALGQQRIQLDWRLTELDRQIFDKAQALIGQEVARLGLGRMQLDDYRDADWPPRSAGAVSAGWHHLGTTRMDPDARKGVVDTNCRVHAMENLFVAGSSVFPTFEGQPTLTIVALAIRLADHLKKQFA